MGRIRTKDIKDVAKDIYRVYPEICTNSFEGNKEKVKELGILNGKSKKYRNRVVGYLVRVVRTAERRKEAIAEEIKGD